MLEAVGLVQNVSRGDGVKRQSLEELQSCYRQRRGNTVDNVTKSNVYNTAACLLALRTSSE